ncbi:MAG: hypothetical protein IKR25_03890 [Muribaculaceae bacterium]|nr:hypothetical protein [Muribaculaceae bacterium]
MKERLTTKKEDVVEAIKSTIQHIVPQGATLVLFGFPFVPIGLGFGGNDKSCSLF